jgi:hypothetical protein
MQETDKDKASKPTLTVSDAREDEKEANATNNLSIPEISDVEIRGKAEKERDRWMDWARTEPNVNNVVYYVEWAKDVAKKYGIPMPELSNVGIREKAEKARDDLMECARKQDNMSTALFNVTMAQIVASRFGISIPELFYDDAKRITQHAQEKKLGFGMLSPFSRLLKSLFRNPIFGT